jgi:hypothetical protein
MEQFLNYIVYLFLLYSSIVSVCKIIEFIFSGILTKESKVIKILHRVTYIFELSAIVMFFILGFTVVIKILILNVFLN